MENINKENELEVGDLVELPSGERLRVVSHEFAENGEILYKLAPGLDSTDGYSAKNLKKISSV